MELIERKSKSSVSYALSLKQTGSCNASVLYLVDLELVGSSEVRVDIAVDICSSNSHKYILLCNYS